MPNIARELHIINDLLQSVRRFISGSLRRESNENRKISITILYPGCLQDVLLYNIANKLIFLLIIALFILHLLSEPRLSS